MNTFRKLLSGFLLLSMFAACSDDIADKKGNEINKGEYDPDGSYLSLDILMPDGRRPFSRSETTGDGGSTAGTEIGSNEENTVSSALIVLARQANYGFIAAGEVRASGLQSLNMSTGTSYRALTRIYKSNLAAYYEDRTDLTVNPQVYVFVFCNPNKDLVDLFRYGETADYNNTLWLDATARVTQGLDGTTDYNMGIWGANSFLMNNVSLEIRGLPKTLVEWEAYSTSDNPFHLSDFNDTKDNPYTTDDLPDNSENSQGVGGAIKVERSVARLDFKDGSDLGNAKYHVLYHAHNGVSQDGSNGEKPEPLIDVQLYTMCLVNMCNSFYYVPRVSNNGRNLPTTSTGTNNNLNICGNEKPATHDPNGGYTGGNYVVGPYWNPYVLTVTSNFTNYFNYAFFEDNGSFNVDVLASTRWGVYNVMDVANGTIKDQYVNSDEGIKQGDYSVWRYITENVIPGGPDNQQNGISTGVVFKARLLGGSFSQDDALNDNSTEIWERDTYRQIADVLNGDSYTLSDGKVYPPIQGNTLKDPIFYYTDGKIYMNWRHLRQAAIQAACTPIYTDGVISGVEINRSNSLYRTVYGDGGIPDGMVYIYEEDGVIKTYRIPIDDRQYSPNCSDYKWVAWDAAGRNDDELLTAFRHEVTSYDVTIYQSSVHTNPVTGEKIPGYYCYYYYWNRHNDNNLNGIMGPMEFAVVRNNVYKLSVDKITRLGHPRIPDNDPNNPTPETPDETAEVYLDVNVQVMPWAVRINSIIF
ncbi:MAG: Mfa1 family fimbria major subunit [Muribaculaceae bacterium]|nr:Mfa1 family fimbria major subunit [Muribaculaceae bacterium]